MLVLDHVEKTFITGTQTVVEAIRDITISVNDREFVAFVGTSGCGKTTLLRLIAGLEVPSSGTITLDGNLVISTNSERGMVFQDFALFPWLTVSQNIAFGPNLQGRPEIEVNSIVARYLILTGLEQFRDSYPHSLSGGMQQRVALARTLASNPRILLLDEPFAALDVQTRSQMQELLSQLSEVEHKTIILVTHDIEEALFLADRVCVLSARPAVLKNEFDVPFEKPRTAALKLSDPFFAMKRRISSFI